MKIHVLDCSAFSSEADLWSAYLAEVQPEGASYFGRNLNAFRDALSGGPGWPAECELHFVNAAAMKDWSGATFLDALIEIAHQSTVVPVRVDSAAAAPAP